MHKVRGCLAPDSPALVQLYTALLRCILQHQVSTMPDGHTIRGQKSSQEGEILSLSMNTRFVAAWPLDSPALVQLYTALLRCILQDQVSTMPDGHAKSRRPRKT